MGIKDVVVSVLAAWLALVGCKNAEPSGDDEPGGLPDARHDAAEPDAPVGMTMIGPEGGELVSGDGILKLTVPPNAIATPTVFTIDLVPAASVPPSVTALQPFSAVYELGPEGTTFATPAKLTWTYATVPAGTRDAMGRPYLIAGISRSAADVLDPHLDTESAPSATGLVVTSQVGHLSQQLLTIMYGMGLQPLATIDVDLAGGMHAVDAPWDARTISALPITSEPGVLVQLYRREGGVVMNDSVPAWNANLVFGDPGYNHGQVTFTAGTPLVPASLPTWKCTTAGVGTVGLTWFAAYNVLPGKQAYAKVKFDEEVTCIVRTPKPEYTAEIAALGAPRITTLVVPGSDMTNIATTMGEHGYTIIIPAGRTVRVCVAASQPTSVNLFPQYSPGYTFVDVAPGCTDVTNLDPNNSNGLLVKVAGAGSPNNVTVMTTLQ